MMRPRILMMGAMSASMILASASMIGNIGGPAAQAASSVVTIPYPAGQLSSFDPTQWSGQILLDQGTVLEGLYGYNTKNQVVPKIAQSYATSDGGRV